MRTQLVATVFLAFSGAFVASAEASSAKPVTLEKQMLYEHYGRFTAAWNRNDPQVMVEFWAEDGDHFATDGRIAEGRDAVRQLFADQLSHEYRGTKLSLTIDSLRFLSPQAVIVNGQFEISGIADGKGGTLPPVRGLHTDIWILEDGQWKIAASRPMLPPKAAAGLLAARAAP
jgi:uncharacterized protein (TIGR02246 family)